LIKDINIIPFTDIVLVVLVVFIVASPILMQSAIKIKLPRSDYSSAVTQSNVVRVYILEDNQVIIDNKTLTATDSLDDLLKAVVINNKPVVINADQAASYGTVAKVLGIAQKYGASKLELTTSREPSTATVQ